MGTYKMKAGDTKARRPTLKQGSGAPMPLGGATVRLVIKNVATGTATSIACTILDADKGKIQFAMGSGQAVGVYQAEFEVSYAGGTIETVPEHEYETVILLADLD